MTARLRADLFAAALRRRVEAEGGTAMVLHRGDPTSGAILLVLADRGVASDVRERVLGLDDVYRWQPAGSVKELDAYVARRRRADPDLWVIELDHRDAAAIAEALTA